MATGLAYENSDLDLAIYGLNIKTKEELAISIQKLAKEFETLPYVTSCQPIATARIPIIKLV